MMSRKFTLREKVLLLVCAVILLGLFYYRVVWMETAETITASNTSSIQDEIMIQEAMSQKKTQMEDELKTNSANTLGEIAPYNNISNEMNELSTILQSADSYELSFSEATLEGTTVRRNIDVTYHASSFQNLMKILQSLHDCKYRCMIGNVNIQTASAQSASIQKSSDLNVSLTITFYETTYNSGSTAGLAQQEPDASAGTQTEGETAK